MVSAQEKQKIIEEAHKLGVMKYISKGLHTMNQEIDEALRNFNNEILN
jgi:response regulator of citrate/malate metabolism